eukprot:1191615-Prorocentrum_minimum.AAC.4
MKILKGGRAVTVTQIARKQVPNYIVLWDENGWTVEDVSEVCYAMCHLYGYCAMPVSLPPPVMYAHQELTGRLYLPMSLNSARYFAHNENHPKPMRKLHLCAPTKPDSTDCLTRRARSPPLGHLLNILNNSTVQPAGFLALGCHSIQTLSSFSSKVASFDLILVN